MSTCQNKTKENELLFEQLVPTLMLWQRQIKNISYILKSKAIT